MEEKAPQEKTIKNLSYDQHEILYNIGILYNQGKSFECDITYSKGNFYGQKGEFFIDQPKYKFDVFPQQEDVVQIYPYTPLPLNDSSIDSIVIDLPFVVSPPNSKSVTNGNDKSNMIFKRFHGFYPVQELYKNYYFWIKEAHRVLRDEGICVFKCQSTVSGGIQHNIEEWSVICAEKVGLITEDKFILGAKNRLISSKVKKQQHARKFTSVFYVFKKQTSKKYKKFNMLNLIEEISEEFGGMKK